MSTNEVQHEDELQACVARIEQLAGHPAVPATDEQLDECERAIGTHLPPKLREWLRAVNGEYDLPIRFYGHRPTLPEAYRIPVVYELYPDLLRAGIYPIGDDGFGNEYAYVAELDCVGFVEVLESDSSVDYLIGSSIPITVHLLLRREGGPDSVGWVDELDRWPFDREATVVLDPDLARVDSSLLPWRQG